MSICFYIVIDSEINGLVDDIRNQVSGVDLPVDLKRKPSVREAPLKLVDLIPTSVTCEREALLTVHLAVLNTSPSILRRLNDVSVVAILRHRNCQSAWISQHSQMG